jgi:CO/xanthine dehydrogenase FAD-binding subunit
VAHFFKFGTRPALDISTISLGFAARRVNGRLEGVRIALGAVAPTPLRALAAEEALEGKALDAETIARAAQTARDEVNPIDDVRASAWYRKEMVHNMMKRMLEHVAQN